MTVISIQELNFLMIRLIDFKYFSKMKCCALCGSIILSHHNQHFKRKRNTYNNDPISPFLGCILLIILSLMVEYTTNENGKLTYICTK